LHWDWLIIPVLTVAGTILLRFSARIERPVLAYFAACLLLAGAGWTGYNQYGTHRTDTEIQTLAYNKVSVGTINFVDLIANMVKEASNEWLPSNEAELFSRHSIDLICREFNVDGKAPIVPEMPWYQWLTQNAKEYKTVLNEVLGNYSPHLPSDLIRAVSEVEQSVFLSWSIRLVGGRRIDKQYGIKRPPVLYPGLEDSLENSFGKLVSLSKEIRNGPTTKKRDENWLQGLRQNYITLGANRFGPKRHFQYLS
jgi:hypothetical protein